MMRKVIWSGTLLLVCGTFAATMAAYYVAECPDSAFSQATVAAYEVCSWFNPVLTVSRMAAVPVVCADKPCPRAEAWMPHPEMPAEPQEPPMPEVGEIPQVGEVPQVGEQPQVAEPIVVEDISLPVIQETQEPAIEGGQQVPFMDPSHDTGVDDVPAFMPYADDDEAVLNAAQMEKPDLMMQLLGCFMNQNSQEELGCTAFAEAVAQFLKELVGDDSETTVVPSAPDDPVENNSPYKDVVVPTTGDSVEENVWTPSDVTPEELPSPRPASTVEQPMPETQPVEGTSETPVGSAPPTTDNVLPANPPPLDNPVGAENPATGTQDSNPPMPQNTNLQEDPSYHHQYPSCPYTGQCPYTGHCPYPYHYNVPSVPYTEPATQPVDVTKPVKPTKAKPTKPVKPAKPVQKKDPMIDLETFGVDTMECRPTDVSNYLPGAGPF